MKRQNNNNNNNFVYSIKMSDNTFKFNEVEVKEE